MSVRQELFLYHYIDKMKGFKELMKVRFHYELHCIMLANLSNRNKQLKARRKLLSRFSTN